MLDSLEDARRQLFTGMKIFPSDHPRVISRYSFLYLMSVWSNTRETSSVFLQPVRLNSVSSTMNTFVRFSSVSSLTVPVACCMYMLLPMNTLQSLYLNTDTTGTTLSLEALHLRRSFPILCSEKNLRTVSYNAVFSVSYCAIMDMA